MSTSFFARTTAFAFLVAGPLSGAHATVFTVTSTADAGTGSLRAAITAANADAASPHTINFNIAGTGVHTITLASGLPAITRPTTLNGYSQPGAAAGTFLARTILVRIVTPAGVANGIEVDASNTVFCGLNIITGTNASAASSSIYHAPNSVVTNNVWIWGCHFGTTADGTARYTGQGGYGIAVYGNTSGAGNVSTASGWIIGTNGDGVNDDREGNIFAPQDVPITGVNNADIIRIFNADNFVIAGNYIGVARDGITPLRTFNSADGQGHGLALSNSTGFRIGTDGNGISDALERNIFSGVNGSAISFLGNPPSGTYLNSGAAYTNRPVGNNLVAGNYFGTDKTGTSTDPGLRNRIAVSLRGATYTTLGSLTNAALRNVIVNSFTTGIRISGELYGSVSSPAQYNNVYSNYIGVLADSVTASPNATGINVNFNNNVTAGTISVYKTTISKNIIAYNTNMGISVSPSPNAAQVGLVYDNTISQNSIYANGGPGINLGSATGETAVTPNDGTLSTPSASNANRLMDYGVIRSASLTGNNLQIDGFIGINAAGTTAFGPNAIVEFFIADNSPADQNGNKFAGDGLSVPHGEGRTYLGSLTANANGLFSGTIDVTGKGFVAGVSYLTNTATEMAATGSTSEFGINVTPLVVSGNVFADANGMTDGLVNSNGGATLPGGLNVVLYDNTTGQVIAVVPVAADGTYTVKGGISSSNYSLYLTTATPTVGQTATPTVALPANWATTGETTGAGSDGTPDGILSLGVLGADVANANFGIEQLPDTDSKSTAIGTPAPGSALSLNGLGGNPPVFTGSDPEDMPGGGSLQSKSVQISSLPTNGELWYNGVLVTAGQVLTNFNPSLLELRFTGSGYTNTSFQYAYVDAAGKADPTPATYTLDWSTPLPLALLTFDAIAGPCQVKLDWRTAAEQEVTLFNVERSADGRSWNVVATIKAGSSPAANTYTATDGQPLPGLAYYRLAVYESTGQKTYSPVRMVTGLTCDRLQATIAPNPARSATKISFPRGTEAAVKIRLTDINGATVRETNAAAGTKEVTIRTGGLAAGLYLVHISSGAYATQLKLVVQ